MKGLGRVLADHGVQQTAHHALTPLCLVQTIDTISHLV
jgi:hypothetical protein